MTLVDELPSLAATPEVWDLASSLARSTRERGITVPATDLLMLATAQIYAVQLLHADRHFDTIRDAIL